MECSLNFTCWPDIQQLLNFLIHSKNLLILWAHIMIINICFLQNMSGFDSAFVILIPFFAFTHSFVLLRGSLRTVRNSRSDTRHLHIYSYWMLVKLHQSEMIFTLDFSSWGRGRTIFHRLSGNFSLLGFLWCFLSWIGIHCCCCC